MKGTLLDDRYLIQGYLGGGGMARVFLARDELLGRRVAVKMLREEFAGDEAFVRRFRREARAAAGLSHPNIVAIYDVGKNQGIDYIVMEYVEGQTLKDLILSHGFLPVGLAVEFGLQALDALEHAHAHGIVHRDIKPQNILLAKSGQVKVADFGIAHAVGSATIVETEPVMGTAYYISPEQARGRPMGPATDIYSFGIVLYEMLTGMLPFDGDTAVQVAMKHFQDPVVPPRAHRPNLPESLNRIILRALQKEPYQRYASAAAMAEHLEHFADIDPDAIWMPPEASQTVDLGSLAGGTRSAGYDAEPGAPGSPGTPGAPGRGAAAGRERASGTGGAGPAGAAVGPQPAGGTGQGADFSPAAGGAGPGSRGRRVTAPGGPAGAGGRSPRGAHPAGPEAGRPAAAPPQGSGAAGGGGGAPGGEGSRGGSDHRAGHKRDGGGDAGRRRARVVRALALWVAVLLILGTGVGYAVNAIGQWLDPPLIPVPSVVGADRDEAARILAETGLNIRSVSVGRYDDETEAGRVLEQEPAPGRELREGGTVNVVLSLGPREVPGGMPDLHGQMSRTAELRLNQLGLEVETVFVFDDEVPADRVMEHTPGPGEAIPQGTVVTLVVSQGPEGGPFALPDLRGRPLAEVRDRVAELGLHIGDIDTEPGDYPPGSVQGQFPAPGETVRPGDTVKLSVSQGNGLDSRQTPIAFTLPPNPESQEVIVTVTDEQGERIVLSDHYTGGQEISATVHWYGDEGVVVVVTNGILLFYEELH